MTDQSQKANTNESPPHGLPPHAHQSTSHNTHLPSSLAYELSTQKILKPSPLRPNKRVSSFSRELSKHPLEVLKRRSNQSGTRQQMMEKMHFPRTVRSREVDRRSAKELLGSQQPAKRSSQMHLPTAAIEPPTDLPPRVRPHFQPSTESSHDQGNPPTHQPTVGPRLSHTQFTRHPLVAGAADDSNFTGTALEDAGGFQARVSKMPSTILMQLDQSSSGEQHEAHSVWSGLEARRSKQRHIHFPRYQISVSRKAVVCPFSEEESSPSHEPETRPLSRRRESHSREEKSRDREDHHHQSTSDEHPHLPSVSPDYMLVGAHFSDNNLVLVDKEGRVIHQLTDTEAESDANIVAQLSELNVHTQTNVDQQEVPHVERFNSGDLEGVAEANKPGTGTIAPPSTALEPGRSGEGKNEKDSLLEQESSGDGKARTDIQVQMPLSIAEHEESGLADREGGKGSEPLEVVH